MGERNDEITVKSAYKLFKYLSFLRATSMQGHEDFLENHVYELQVAERVKLTNWKEMHDSWPSREVLVSINIYNKGMCPIFGT